MMQKSAPEDSSEFANWEEINVTDYIGRPQYITEGRSPVTSAAHIIPCDGRSSIDICSWATILSGCS